MTSKQFFVTQMYERVPPDRRHNPNGLMLVGWRLHLLEGDHIVRSIDFHYSDAPEDCDDPDRAAQNAAEQEGKTWGSEARPPAFLDLNTLLGL